MMPILHGIKISLIAILMLAGCAIGTRHSEEEQINLWHTPSSQCHWPLVHGCKGIGASFKPRLPSTFLTQWQNESLPLAGKLYGGLKIAVDEYASPNKSRAAFDSDVSRNGVLPLLIGLENTGNKNLKLRQNRIRASLNDTALKSLYGYEAARQGATRNYVWPALASTILSGPLAIYFSPAFMALSANHTKSVNQRIERHFESLELTDTLLKPNDTLAGFVFFKIPEGSPTLQNLVLEIAVEIEDPEGITDRIDVYRLPFPVVEVSQ